MSPSRRLRKWLRRDRFEAVEPWSVRAAMFFDRLGLTANWMTFLGLVFCAPAAFAFAMNYVALGTACMILSLLTDWFDGALGRYQEATYRKARDLEPLTPELESQLSIMARMNFRGVTHFGRSFDPFVDKARMIAFFTTIGYVVIDLWIISAIVVVAILLTLIRPLKSWLQIDDTAANRFGKYKIFAEIAGMAAVVFLWPWREGAFYATLVDYLFVGALILGLLSLGGHLYTGIRAYRRKRVLTKHATRVVVRQSRARRAPSRL